MPAMCGADSGVHRQGARTMCGSRPGGVYALVPAIDDSSDESLVGGDYRKLITRRF